MKNIIFFTALIILSIMVAAPTILAQNCPWWDYRCNSYRFQHGYKEYEWRERERRREDWRHHEEWCRYHPYECR
jgi:hypothetical protein